MKRMTIFAVPIILALPVDVHGRLKKLLVAQHEEKSHI